MFIIVTVQGQVIQMNIISKTISQTADSQETDHHLGLTQIRLEVHFIGFPALIAIVPFDFWAGVLPEAPIGGDLDLKPVIGPVFFEVVIHPEGQERFGRRT